MANDKWLEELGDQLREHRSEVNPNLWQGISSQIGANASGAAAAGGMSFAKIAAIVGVSVTTVALTYFAFNSPREEKVNTTAEVQTEGPTTEKETIVVEKPTAETKSIDAKTRSEKALVTEKETIVKQKEVTTIVLNNEPALTEIVAPKAPESILSIKEKTQKTTPTTQPKEVERIEEQKPVQNELPPLVNKVTKPQTPAEFISLPNVFTPNGDGVNDEFFVVTTGMENYSLVVLDANSQVVWKTNNPDERWDGKSLNGDKLPIGSYIYFITAQDELGTPVNKHQRLQLQ
ncbi:MAG: gliding motility-associated C-terminal domain-containing protein [Crocinitomicaceae bacterium]